METTAPAPTAYKIFNGLYTIINPETDKHRVFKVRTVKRGNFKGKRLVEVKESHRFRAFAFADAKDNINVWHRYRNWERGLYSKYANLLGSIARDGDASTYVTERGIQWKLAKKCRSCNRNLTIPISIEMGIGPICQQKIADYKERMKAEWQRKGMDMDLEVELGFFDED